MSRTGDEHNGQDDVDAIFGEIVADLRADGVGTRMDTDTRDDPPASTRDDSEGGGERGAQAPAAGSDWRTSDVGWDDTMLSGSTSADDDDEHFVPPEPPPLPKPTRSMGVVALFFVLGLLLLIAPHIIGISATIATPLGILSLAAGLGFLLLHARDDQRPSGSDGDDGAQV